MSETTTTTAQDTTKAVEAVNNVADTTKVVDAKAVDTGANAQAQQVQTEIVSKEAESATKEGGEGQQAAKPQVPEKYELQLPEKTLLESEAIERIAGLARERGLSNEQAQELVDLEHDAVATYHNKNITAFMERTENWKKEVMADKEIGGDNLNKSLSLVNRFLAKYDTDGSFRKDLEVTRYGNHPGLIKVLYRAAKESLGEDEFVQAQSSNSAKKSIQEILYSGNNNEANS